MSSMMSMMYHVDVDDEDVHHEPQFMKILFLRRLLLLLLLGLLRLRLLPLFPSLLTFYPVLPLPPTSSSAPCPPPLDAIEPSLDSPPPSTSSFSSSLSLVN